MSRSEKEYLRHTIKCDKCCSVNHLLEFGETEAWQCYNCSESYFLDDLCRITYMARTDRKYQESEQDLKDGKPIFAEYETFGLI